jgi:hypothetical protein
LRAVPGHMRGAPAEVTLDVRRFPRFVLEALRALVHLMALLPATVTHLRTPVGAGQDKTRQDKTKQDKTRQDKTRQDKTRQNKT